MTVNIISLGKYIPSKSISIEEIKEKENLTTKRIKRLGIECVHVADDEETNCSMAINAAREAMKNAGVSGEDIDLVIYTVGFIPDYLVFPDHAFIQYELGINNATSFNIVQGCSGVVPAIEVATALLHTKQYKKVMIIAAEQFNSHFVNRWSSSSFCIYGDGSGAIILSTDSDSMEVLSTAMYTDGKYSTLSYFEYGNACTKNTKSNIYSTDNTAMKFWQNHEDEKREFSSMFLQRQKWILEQALEKANLNINQLNYLIMYNMSLDYYIRLFNILDFPIEKTSYRLASKYGHLGTADLLVNFYDELEQKKFSKGDIVGFLCTGSGYSWGSCIIRI